MNWWTIIFSCVLVLATLEMPFAQERKWEDSAELSYVQTGGNTDVMTFSAKNELKYKFSENWSGSWKLGALYGKTDGILNAERYFTDLRTDYKATEKLYYYALGGWLQDEFAGIDSRINTVSALTTQRTDMFSLKTTYEMNYQNEPSPDTLEKTDTLLSVALVVSF